jgi:hypothetical protein
VVAVALGVTVFGEAFGGRTRSSSVTGQTLLVDGSYTIV